ncbi:hypothetical protein J4475_01460 [Candidatus Woesearchaeota archaeon]|nr:hypothetical protein [Candidatus Woesearchaeota archaeon]
MANLELMKIIQGTDCYDLGQDGMSRGIRTELYPRLVLVSEESPDGPKSFFFGHNEA